MKPKEVMFYVRRIRLSGLSIYYILVTGTLFVMWLGEKITDGGVGNGISLLIMIGIIAVLPSSLSSEFGQ